MTPWDRAQTALALLAIDPVGLGGIVVRGRAGPARDAFAQMIRDRDPIKLHPAMTNDALDGGIDLTTTLETGKIVNHAGLLARGGLFTLAMSERTTPYLAARLGMALDAGGLHGLIAMDEGIDDEKTPTALTDRLAFCVTMDDIALADLQSTLPHWPHADPVTAPDDLPAQLVVLAAKFGIHSLRAPLFAWRTAKVHAALMHRTHVDDDDIAAAVAMVYAHRATQLPSDDDAPAPQQPPEQPPEQSQSDALDIPDDMLLDAVMSALPTGLLDQLQTPTAKGGTGAGSGRKILGNRRGRPLSARNVTARANARIDLMATLRVAIPWQTMRRATQPDRKGPIIRPSDLRAKRYQDLSDRVLVFAVDASGSAALARLNEAKGAIEILLAEAYSRRDHVALIAFRDTKADVLLPPTRSLVQTKRRLAQLPGGGSTPLAAGLLCALEMAQSTAKRGQTPTIVVLTDGRSNIALDGTPNRQQAAADASTAARQIHLSGYDAIMIDTGQRPDRSLHDLARTMGAHYVPLPRADAKRVSDAVSTTLQA